MGELIKMDQSMGETVKKAKRTKDREKELKDFSSLAEWV